MGWQFRKSTKVGPFRMNFGKSGFTSVSLGGRIARVSVGKRGVYRSINIPGTGISHREKVGGGRDRAPEFDADAAARAADAVYSLISTQTPEQQGILVNAYREDPSEMVSVVCEQMKAATELSGVGLDLFREALVRYMDRWVATT